MFESRIKNEQADLLMEAVLRLNTAEDAYRFFEDICTIPELRSIAQRLEVAGLLRNRVTYQEIARRTGASSATISRVNRALLYGAEGYNRVLDALEADGFKIE
jgi:TrpR-related protein YerC/YecD